MQILSMISTLKKWWPVLAYVLFIIALSSIPPQRLPSEFKSVSDKLLHVVLYSGAGFVIRRASSSSWQSVGLGAVIGALDENYQRFVGRNCSWEDWVADVIGVILGTLFYLAYARLRYRPASS